MNYFVWYRIPILPTANIFISVGAGIIVYGIVRYRLMEIKVAAIRSIIVTVVCIPILAVPFIMGIVFKGFLEGQFDALWWLIPMFSLSAAIPICIMIYRFLNERGKQVILSRQLNFLSVLREFLENIKNIRNLPELEKLLVERISVLLNVSFIGFYRAKVDAGEYCLTAAKTLDQNMPYKDHVFPYEDPIIYLLNKTKKPLVKDEISFRLRNELCSSDFGQAVEEMNRLEISVVVPSFHGEDLIAIITLGERKISEPYSNEDIEAFKLLGMNTGLAVKNALFVEELNTLNSDLLASERLAAIGRLATSAKHNISNPLNIVYGNLQQAMMDIKDRETGYKRALEYLGCIRKKIESVLPMSRFAKNVDIGNISDICERAAEDIRVSFNRLPPTQLKERLWVITQDLSDQTEKIRKLDTKNTEERQIKEELLQIAETAKKHISKVRDLDVILYGTIEKALTNAGRITQAINTIYNLPKELEAEAEPISLKELIESSLEFTGYQSYWENLSDTTIEKHIPEDLPKAKGYLNRLISVFSNIFLNAYQAMTRADLTTLDERVIRIKILLMEEHPGYIEIRVANRGPAIPQNDLENIFRPGYSTKEAQKGVGLDICKTQIEVFHGGEICARNIGGFGPEFIVKLPVWDENNNSAKNA